MEGGEVESDNKVALVPGKTSLHTGRINLGTQFKQPRFLGAWTNSLTEPQRLVSTESPISTTHYASLSLCLPYNIFSWSGLFGGVCMNWTKAFVNYYWLPETWEDVTREAFCSTHFCHCRPLIDWFLGCYFNAIYVRHAIHMQLANRWRWQRHWLSHEVSAQGNRNKHNHFF